MGSFRNDFFLLTTNDRLNVEIKMQEIESESLSLPTINFDGEEIKKLAQFSIRLDLFFVLSFLKQK